ncbi:hypothetical protein BJX70DRAFT_401740 [Aspergillus crustosus]
MSRKLTALAMMAKTVVIHCIGEDGFDSVAAAAGSYHNLQWRISPTEWWQTVDITLHAVSNIADDTWPATTEAVELWFSVLASSNADSTAWMRLEHGPVSGIYEAQDVVQRGDLEYPFIGVNEARHGTEVVLEQYCDGPEVDINFVLSKGELLFCEISDNFPKTADVSGTGSLSNTHTSFIELGNVLPSKLPSTETNLLRNSLHQSLNRLSLTTGIYHLEARVQNSSIEYGAVSTAHTTSERSTPAPPGIQETAAVESIYGIDYWGVALICFLRDHTRLRALSHPFTQGPQYQCETVFIPVECGGIFESDDVCTDQAAASGPCKAYFQIVLLSAEGGCGSSAGIGGGGGGSSSSSSS